MDQRDHQQRSQANQPTPRNPTSVEATGAARAPLRRTPRRHRVLASAAATAAALAGIGLSQSLWPTDSSGTAKHPSAEASAGVAATASPVDAAVIAAKVDPALVDINLTFNYQDAEGAGTGIVLTSSGEILTNNHVIQGETGISVTDIGNGKTYRATVVGYDPAKDIAVLQLQHASGLQTVALGDSSTARVGATVVGVGDAGGVGGTPASAGGSVTALDQSITAAEEIDNTNEQLSGVLETNADIQPGDSGGPLVDSAGQVIGIDTAASQSFVFQGSTTEAYAIPIDTALAVASAIEAGQGSASVHVGATAFMGIRVEASAQAQQDEGLGFGASGTGAVANVSGLAVIDVVSGKPAARSGLVVGDVITSFGGHQVASEQALSSLLLLDHPGDSVEVVWTTSSGATQSAVLTLGSGPPA